MSINNSMSDLDVLKIILDCAELYRDNLVDKNMIIINYNSKTQTYNYIETVFLKRNFLHLTGVMIRPGRNQNPYNKQIGGSDDFYELCLKKKLKGGDFKQAPDGTTPLKMRVLPQLMRFNGNMMGDFNFTKNQLRTDKIIGNVIGCMGFVKEKEYYIPNTTLQEDIRDITTASNSIVCILEKTRYESKYKTVRYLKIEKEKKKKKAGKTIIIPPINHIEGICSLDIIKEKADKTIF